MKSQLLTVFVLSLLFATSAFAKRFTSQYTEFELPPGWECSLEGTEWVCQSTNDERKKEAIIILAAKKRGPQDSLDEYMKYLKAQKTFTLPGGKTQVSEAKYSNIKTIADHQWVDSLHLASEVPGFYTRYLATVKEDLGVAVTFSVAKDHYQAYQSMFDKIVESLRVFRQKAGDGSFAVKKKDENLLGDSTFIPDGDKAYDIGQKGKKGAGSGLPGGDMLLYGIAAAVVGGLVLAMKKKGGKGGGKKKG